jgi:hypothetical protein
MQFHRHKLFCFSLYTLFSVSYLATWLLKTYCLYFMREDVFLWNQRLLLPRPASRRRRLFHAQKTLTSRISGDKQKIS